MSLLPANWQAPETPPPEEKSELRKSFAPILITMGVAIVLTAGSVFGALATCGGMNSAAGSAFSFFVGCAMLFCALFVLSAGWLILSLIIKLLQSFKSSR
ncbi:MAG TPA: hypothetical protein VMJ35_10405 [Dongiaceae bacterium]|nr:hypothetical protein [Dongiaceae bacterium]